jgi:hypothetical protein
VFLCTSDLDGRAVTRGDRVGNGYTVNARRLQ